MKPFSLNFGNKAFKATLVEFRLHGDKRIMRLPRQFELSVVVELAPNRPADFLSAVSVRRMAIPPREYEWNLGN